MHILDEKDKWEKEEKEEKEAILKILKEMLNEDCITNTSRVSIVWDNLGQWVDLDYEVSEDGVSTSSCLCYAELYEDGTPNEDSWIESKNIAQILSEEYDLPIYYRSYKKT